LTAPLEENIRAAQRFHGRITPTYPLGQRNGRIRNYKGVRDLLQRYVYKAGLAGHTAEAQTVRYLRDMEIPLVYGPSFVQ
jgi:hypothetical protein